jgi:serine/threonine-protein phosphatase CPPED1
MNARALQALVDRALRWLGVTVTFLALALGFSGCVHRPASSFTFVQLCDPQLGMGGYAEDVARFRQAVKQINDLNPDFVVVCGDLVNAAGPQSFADFSALKATLRMPCYCAPGNHDLGNAPTLQTLQRYRKFIGKDYFAFNHKGCVFVVVDSQLWKAPLPGESEKQDAWLKQTLQAAAKSRRPVFVIDHYPLFEKDPEEAEQYFNLPLPGRRELLALFQQSGVVALLSGHTHKTIIHRFGGIEMVASQTTSTNFDQQPFGLRLWHVGAQPPYRHEFVPLR